jgi:hypothetical protein
MRATTATSRLSSLLCPITQPNSSMRRRARMSAGAAIGTPGDRLLGDGRDGTASFFFPAEPSAQTSNIRYKTRQASSASSCEAEPDRYRHVDAGLGSPVERAGVRTAHHSIDASCPISRTPGHGEVNDAAAALDGETQNRTTLLTPLAGRIGVALVAFEPCAQQGKVISADFGR